MPSAADEFKVAWSVKIPAAIASAATDTMKVAADALKLEGRASIAAGGFSSKWTNAWRTLAFPKGGKKSINAAAFGWHKIPYSLIFETGGTIFGKKGLLWIPFKSAPKLGGKRPTVSAFMRAGIKLFKLPTSKPILAASIKVNNKQAADTNFRPSVAQLRRGQKAKRGTSRAVPLFVGESSVKLTKRFHISDVAKRVSQKVPSYYLGAMNKTKVK